MKDIRSIAETYIKMRSGEISEAGPDYPYAPDLGGPAPIGPHGMLSIRPGVRPPWEEEEEEEVPSWEDVWGQIQTMYNWWNGNYPPRPAPRNPYGWGIGGSPI